MRHSHTTYKPQPLALVWNFLPANLRHRYHLLRLVIQESFQHVFAIRLMIRAQINHILDLKHQPLASKDDLEQVHIAHVDACRMTSHIVAYFS